MSETICKCKYHLFDTSSFLIKFIPIVLCFRNPPDNSVTLMTVTPILIVGTGGDSGDPVIQGKFTYYDVELKNVNIGK